MKYSVIEKNQRHVENIAKALRKAGALFLATDRSKSITGFDITADSGILYS